MNILRQRMSVMLAGAAMLSLAATPAAARDWDRRNRGNGIDAGDVFAGLLIVGGIAAIAAAASKSKKDRQAREDAWVRDDDRRNDYRTEDYRDAPPADYGDDRVGDQSIDYGRMDNDQAYRDQPTTAGRSDYGVDAAVDACVGEVERGNRSVETIDGVNREGQGWRVGGRVAGGYGFSCLIDGKGRVKSVEGL